MRLPAGTFACENPADHGGCGGLYDANFNVTPEAGVVGKKATHGVHRAIGVFAEGISVGSARHTSQPSLATFGVIAPKPKAFTL